MSVRRSPIIEPEWRTAPIIEPEWESAGALGRVSVSEFGSRSPALETLW
ncbi:MAG TPA: hypothetical protein VNE86_07280 [Nitrososphaerales archaeon]|nr:hypothetical protein [Nitrososphaerales archaeon]